jgi:hypothetical protein
VGPASVDDGEALLRQEGLEPLVYVRERCSLVNLVDVYEVEA